jgi:hypothetical protein
VETRRYVAVGAWMIVVILLLGMLIAYFHARGARAHLRYRSLSLPAMAPAAEAGRPWPPSAPRRLALTPK